MKKYQCKNPNNSRIFIDYKNKKNPVRFSYPIKKNIFFVVLTPFLSLWVKTHLILLLLFVGLSQFFYFDFPSKTFLILAFAPPLILAFIFSKNNSLLSCMPKINRFSSFIPFGTMKYKLIKRLDSKNYEIILFNNVFLDYKATKEFSIYLKKVEITEHDFRYIKKRLFLKTKKEANDIYWKANFYFQKIPKDGKLEVWYK